MSGVNLKRKFKLNETGNKSVQEVLNSQFKNVGPFSKESDQSDVMSGLSDLWKAMEKGVELKSTKVHKEHLVSFVKAIAIHQGWVEEIVQPTGDDETGEVNDDEVNDSDEDQESETDDDENDQKIERSKSVEKALNVNSERKNLHSNVCKFYRSAKCKYGMRGKTKDKRGNTCQFEHPPICQKFRMFEKNPEKGCLEKECDKLHYNFCKWYHDCKNKEDCKFYHPKQGKQTKPMRSNNQNSFQPREGSRPERRFEYNNRDSSEKTNFLGHRYPPQVTSRVWENQDHQYKQTGPENMREQRLRDILSNMENMFQQAKSIMQ